MLHGVHLRDELRKIILLNCSSPGFEGAHKAFNRSSDAGRKVEYHFCTECGSTVFWYREATPELTAIGWNDVPRGTMDVR